jgi:hypothetical protein
MTVVMIKMLILYLLTVKISQASQFKSSFSMLSSLCCLSLGSRSCLEHSNLAMSCLVLPLRIDKEYFGLNELWRRGYRCTGLVGDYDHCMNGHVDIIQPEFIVHHGDVASMDDTCTSLLNINPVRVHKKSRKSTLCGRIANISLQKGASSKVCCCCCCEKSNKSNSIPQHIPVHGSNIKDHSVCPFGSLA